MLSLVHTTERAERGWRSRRKSRAAAPAGAETAEALGALEGAAAPALRLAEPSAAPQSEQYQTLGQFLRAVRESKGLSLVDMSVETRVHKNQLAALEAGDLSKLPSRPFTIGYVRTYAKALGLDPEAQVGRFRQEFPEDSPQLRAPIGVAHEDRESRPLLYVGAGVLVAAVVLWNIAQRTLISTASAHGPAIVAGESWPEPPSNTVIAVGGPTPAPADQNTPKPWTTPGLDPAPAAASAAAKPPPGDISPTFTPKGAVYGAANGPIVVQANKSGSLVVRGGGGEVYFARELAQGEAYRAAAGRGLTAEVSDPTAMLVYVGGQFKGVLSDLTTPLDKFAAVAPPAQPVAVRAAAPSAPAAAPSASGAPASQPAAP